MATQIEIAKVLASFEAAGLVRANESADPQLSRLRLAVWESQFCNVSYSALSAAASQHIRSSRYFPTPADIWSILDAARAAAVNAPTAAEAWQMLQRTTEPAALPPVVAAALERFGRMRFRMRLVDDEATNYAQFRTIYDQLAARLEYAATRTPALSATIAGLIPAQGETE